MTFENKITKTKIIRDLRGHRLVLTPTRLVQIEHTSTNPWCVRAEDLRKAYAIAREYNGKVNLTIREVGSPFHIQGPLDIGRRYIGCCSFGIKTFNSILRHFRIRKPRAAKARA